MNEKIVSIQKLGKYDSRRYDLTVKDNNNFFANEILVHNCQNFKKEFSNEWANTSGWSISEKVDGQSLSIFTQTRTGFFGLRTKQIFGVCSRSIYKKTNDNSSHWQCVVENDLEKKIRAVPFNVAIQGENVGGKVQGNPYKFNGYKFYVFNVKNLDVGKKYTNQEVEQFCKEYGFESVPYLDHNYTLPGTIDELLTFADGKSKLNPSVDREGIVVRKGDVSFKCISNKYLLKQKD